MSALLETLRYRAETTNTQVQDDGSNTEGKFGVPRFDGNPNQLPEYTYRVKTRIAKEAAMTKEEVNKLGPLGLRLVEGLRGQALRLAQQLSIKKLASGDGPEELLKIFNTSLKPRREQEARELYAAGCREGGPMARQNGEPMSSYVARRRAWWAALQGLDSELQIPDLILSEQILQNAGITEDHKLMIRTILGGKLSTDKVIAELLSQHPNIHDRERRGKGHHGGKGWRQPFRSKGRAFLSEDVGGWQDEWENGSQSLAGYTAVLEEETYDPEPEDAYGYVAETQTEYEQDDEGYVVLNFALLCEDGLDLNNEEACALAAESLQLEHEAYLLRNQGKGKGHGGFHQQRHFDISGSVSFQERKARLAQLKAKTECRRCGAKGHWSGDAACPKGAKKGSFSKSSNASASTRTGQGGSKGGGKSGKNQPPKPRVVYFSTREPDQGTFGMGYMALDERQAGACVPPPTSLQSATASGLATTSLQSATASGLAPTSLQSATASGLAPMSMRSSMTGAENFANSLTRAMEFSALQRGVAGAAKTFEPSDEPTEVIGSDGSWDEAEVIVPRTEEPETPAVLTDDQLLSALGPPRPEQVHAALQALTYMDVDSQGVQPEQEQAWQLAVPQTERHPDEILRELRVKQLDEFLAQTPISDPRYEDAYNERWCEFAPGHSLRNEADRRNQERWLHNMRTGHRPELERKQPARPRTEKQTVATTATTSATIPLSQRQRECPHRNTTKKGTNKYYEMETCLDCHMQLRREPKFEPKEATAIVTVPPSLKELQDACPHHQVSMKGSNGFQWRNTCKACGKVASGYYLYATAGEMRRAGYGRGRGAKTSSSTLAPTSIGVQDAEEIFRNCMVVAKVKASEDPTALNSERMHMILDAVMAATAFTSSGNAAASASTPSPDVIPPDYNDDKQFKFGEFKGLTFLHVYRNQKSYVDWCLDQAGKAPRQLKEFITYIQRKNTTRLGYMAVNALTSEASETHLIAVLDSGCNKTCHGDRWLERYLKVTGEPEESFPLTAETGGGFRGIGGSITTTGSRAMNICFELEQNGMAVGAIDSIELEGSDAPLLLSISDQRKLGLTVQLSQDGDRIYSSTLGSYLVVEELNGLLGIRLLPQHMAMLAVPGDLKPGDVLGEISQAVPPPMPLTTSTIPDLPNPQSPKTPQPSHQQPLEPSPLQPKPDLLGPELTFAGPPRDWNQEDGLLESQETYVAVEEVNRRTMTKGQRKQMEQSVNEIQAGDQSLWANLKDEKHKTPLPRGCKVFLLEIFAGAALLTSLALAMGLTAAAPIDIALDGTNLLDPKVRAEIEHYGAARSLLHHLCASLRTMGTLVSTQPTTRWSNSGIHSWSTWCLVSMPEVDVKDGP